jgi:hypothetical protein
MAKPLKINKISPGGRPHKAARQILRTRIKEFYSHWSDPDRLPTPEQLHNLRISGKRLRYSAESLRDLYPDRLALLIDILKRSQDLLGIIQDCVTQRDMLTDELARIRRRKPQSDQIAILEKIASEYEQRQSTLFTQYRETWQGMTMKEFRECFEAMAKRVKKTKRAKPAKNSMTDEPALPVISVANSLPAAKSLPIDQTGDEARAETVVDVDDGNV